MKTSEIIVYNMFLFIFIFTTNTLFAYSDILVHTRGRSMGL